eukprot:g6420.t1
MRTCALLALCLCVLLSDIQLAAETHNTAIADKLYADMEDEWEIIRLADIGSTSRDLLQSQAMSSAPGPSPCCYGFSDSINTEIKSCSRELRELKCGIADENENYRITGTSETTRRSISERNCCCACEKSAQCNAIHYNRSTRKCIFHCGGTPKFDFEIGRKAWIKG